MEAAEDLLITRWQLSGDKFGLVMRMTNDPCGYTYQLTRLILDLAGSSRRAQNQNVSTKHGTLLPALLISKNTSSLFASFMT